MTDKNLFKLLAAPALALAVSAGYGLRVAAENVPTQTPLFYAGTLEEGGKLVDGLRTISLAVWDKEADGKMICQSTTEKAQVSAGHFRVALSEACVLELRGANKPTDVWIALSFKDEGGTPHDIPGRSKVGAMPFALRAEHATSAERASGPLLGQVVPAGMISMFARACPEGWAEFKELRGRVPRGEPMGNAGALDNGGNDDAVVVSHTHVGAAGGGEHVHSGSTLGQSRNHVHGGTTDISPAWDDCIIHGSGGSDSIFQPAVFGTHFVGGDCRYQIRTNHAHNFTTGANDADHTHAFEAGGGGHTHSFTTGDASGAVAKGGQNMQAFREVIFCIKQ